MTMVVVHLAVAFGLPILIAREALRFSTSADPSPDPKRIHVLEYELGFRNDPPVDKRPVNPTGNQGPFQFYGMRPTSFD